MTATATTEIQTTIRMDKGRDKYGRSVSTYELRETTGRLIESACIVRLPKVAHERPVLYTDAEGVDVPNPHFGLPYMVNTDRVHGVSNIEGVVKYVRTLTEARAIIHNLPWMAL